MLKPIFNINGRSQNAKDFSQKVEKFWYLWME